MVFKKKEQEPTPPSPAEKEEARIVAFTAHLAMNGWFVQEQFSDGCVEEYVFVGKTSYDELGAYLFPRLAPKLPVASEEKKEALPIVENEMRLTKEEIAILESLQKKSGMRYDPKKDEDEQL